MVRNKHGAKKCGDVQIKEGELAWLVAVLVDEPTGQVATEDGTEIVLGDL